MNGGPSLDLGVVGNCAISALIDRQARVVWSCMPRFDGDPVFHSLLDSPQGIGPDGSYEIGIEGLARSEQAYDPGTAVLRTRLCDEHDEHDEHGAAIESQCWRTWTRRLALPLDWQDAVIRAAITLKLCLYEDTGAIIAAMTTCIPEAQGSRRNWDYRFCWLRDAIFVVRALNSLSEVGTMEDYLRWLHNVISAAAGDHIQPPYGIGLERELTEYTGEHLRGARGMGPVGVGSQASEHFQHDVYGNIVLRAAQFFHDQRLFRRGTVEDFALFEAIGERAFAVHDWPDAGMWELRPRARVHTSSMLMNWAACDRLAKIALALALPERAALWRSRADLIHAKLLQSAWSDARGPFVESFGGKDLASVRLMAEVGFIDPRDPRFVSTVGALEASLCGGRCMRCYESPDDFGRPETAFNICAFWRIDALARIGRTQQGEVVEAMLAARNHLGLLSEDTHPVTGELWGNFPQTYSMVGIVNGAMRLSAPWDSRV